MRPAIASKCTTALVEPPIAAFTRIAFSYASRVSIFAMPKSSSTICTMRRPVNCASRLRRVSGAGIAAFSGNDMPNASTMLAMVDAVPIVMQWPLERFMQDSASVNSFCDICPALTISDICQTPVPEPISLPRNLPFNIGPPDKPIVGKPQLAAPISNAGVVLSQPISNTTPSIGLPLMDSSTSMLARLRNNIAVGRNCVSPSDITGNSSGNPPASRTPRLTNSAKSRK